MERAGDKQHGSETDCFVKQGEISLGQLIE
jgi:hypothetical protein